MDIEQKVALAKQCIDNIATHDDAPATQVIDALQDIGAHCTNHTINGFAKRSERIATRKSEAEARVKKNQATAAKEKSQESKKAATNA